MSGIDRTAFIHPQALVEAGADVGPGTRVWAFAHLASGAKVGADCNVCDQTFIEGQAFVGDRVTIKCGVYLWDGVTVEDDVFVGPGAVFTNDLRPRSRQRPGVCLPTILRRGCSIGANATILAGLAIGRWAMVGAGAVVTREVPDFALVVGNPARRNGWVCRCGRKLPSIAQGMAECSCGRGYRKGNGEHSIEEVERGL